MTSGYEDSWGGIDITRMHHSVTLYVESSWNVMAHSDTGGEVKGKLANGVGNQ
jgi:hypothetical protein